MNINEALDNDRPGMWAAFIMDSIETQQNMARFSIETLLLLKALLAIVLISIKLWCITIYASHNNDKLNVPASGEQT